MILFLRFRRVIILISRIMQKKLLYKIIFLRFNQGLLRDLFENEVGVVPWQVQHPTDPGVVGPIDDIYLRVDAQKTVAQTTV